MSEFRKPSPEMEAVYERIVALCNEGVWVPATSNGGLRQLLAEMEFRGWKVIPSQEEDEKIEYMGELPYRQLPDGKICCICGELLRNCPPHSKERVAIWLLSRKVK